MFFKWLAWTSTAHLVYPLPPEVYSWGSAQVLLGISIFQAVFLWVALDLPHSAARDLSRGFVQTPWAGKCSALSHWSARRVGNALEAHSIFARLGFHSVQCSWVLMPTRPFLGLQVGVGVADQTCHPPLLPRCPHPHSLLKWSVPHRCCWDCNFSLTKMHLCPISFL